MNDAQDTGRAQEQPAKPLRPAVTPAAPVLPLGGQSSGKEAWREGSGCGGRFVLWGAALGVALLVALLVAGTAMMRRTVWANFDAARQAIVNALPQGISPAEHLRTRRNLDRFRAVLERSDDPYPLMGEFVRRKQAMLQDGRLTDEEIETLNLVLERWIEESGVPPMQLGQGVRSEELGVRSYRRLAAQMPGGGRVEIPNS